MKRLLTWSLRLIGLAVVLIAGIVVLLHWFAPSALESAIVQKLHALGFKNPVLTVEVVDSGHTLVRGLTLGDDNRLTLETGLITYQPGDLWGGRLEAVQLTGLTLRAAYKDGKLDLGELADLKLPVSTPAPAPGGDSGGVPLKRVELRDAAVKLDTDDGAIVVRIDGTVDFVSAAEVKVNVTASTLGFTARIKGTVNLKDGGATSQDLTVGLEMARTWPLTPNVTADTLVAQLPLELTANRELVRAKLRGQAQTTLKRLIVNNSPPVVIQNVQGTLEDDEKTPLVEWKADTGEVRALAILGLGKPLSLTTPAASATVESMWGWVSLKLPAKGNAELQSRIDTRIATVRIPAANVFIETIQASLPISLNTDSPITSGFTTSEILLGADKLPALGGSVSIADGKITITADWPVLSSVLLEVGGKYDAGRLELSAKVPPSKITDGRTLGRLFSAIGDVELVGEVAMDAKVVVSDEGLTPRLTLNLTDASIIHRQLGVTAEGVTGQVTFTRFSPLTTPGHQELRVRKASLGKLSLDDGVITFRIEGAKTMFVERIGFRVGDSGSLLMHAVYFDAEQPAAGEPGAGAGALGRMDLRDSSLLVELPNQSFMLRLNGSVAFTSGEQATVDLTAASPDLTGRLSGAVDFKDGGGASKTLKLSLETTRPLHLASNITAEGIAAEIPLDLSAGAGRVVAHLRPRAQLTIGKVTVAGDQPVTIENIGGTMEEDEKEPLAQWTAADGLKAMAIVGLSKPLSVATPMAGATLESLWGWARITQAGTGPVALQSRIDARLTGIKVPAAKIAIDAIDASIPISFNTDAPITSGFKTTDIMLGKDKLPPLGGSVAVADGKITITADWPVLSTVLMQVGGSYDAGKLELSARIPPSQVTDGRALGQLFSAIGDVEVVGGVALDAKLTIAGGTVTPDLLLKLTDASVASRVYQITAEGVKGSVHFTHLSPLTTPGHQRVQVGKLVFGKLELDDGVVDFRVEDVKKLFMEKAAFHVGDTGAFKAHAIFFDADKPEVSTEVFVEDLNLGAWITLLSGQNVKGTGQMYGRVPVTFRPDSPRKIELGQGFIYAKPGTAELDLGSSEKVAQLLKGTENSLSANEQVKQQIMQALTKFEYSNFRFELSPDPDGGTMLKVETKGVGRGGGRTVELEGITVNLHGFDQMLNVALFLKNQGDKALQKHLQRKR